MAFTNSSDIEAALNRCSTMDEWDNFRASVHIPEDFFPLANHTLLELSLKDITFEVS